MTLEDKLSVLKQLFVAYPNTQVTEQTVAVYLKLLQDIPVADLQTVVDQCIAQYKFLPSVAELRDMHRTLTVNLLQPLASEAWGEVRRAISSYGHVRIPEFEDPLVAEIVKHMGWRELCISENQVSDRARFMQIYEQLQNRQEQGDKLLPPARNLLESRRPKQLEHIANALSNTIGD